MQPKLLYLVPFIISLFSWSHLASAQDTSSMQPLGCDDSGCSWVTPNQYVDPYSFSRNSMVIFTSASGGNLVAGKIYNVDCFGNDIQFRGTIRMENSSPVIEWYPEGDWIGYDPGSSLEQAVTLFCTPIVEDYLQRTGN